MVSTLARSLWALPFLTGFVMATNPKTVTVTEVKPVYHTATITETTCYTTTAHGEPTTITHYKTKTEVSVSYCTETLTTTEKFYKTDTETISVEGPTETIYKPTTAVETIYKPTTEVDYQTVYKPTTETDYETVYKPTTEKVVETCTVTKVVPTTIYVKKYHTKTVYKPQPTTYYDVKTVITTDYDKVVKTLYITQAIPTTIWKHKYETQVEYQPTTIWKHKYEVETITLPGKTHYITEIEDQTKYIHKTEYITVSEVHTVTDVEKYTKTIKEVKPGCTDAVTVYTTTLITLPIFVPTATSYIYEDVYLSYHVNTAGSTASYTTTSTSNSITRTTRPPQTTAYEPGYKTKQPVPQNPCATVTSTITLIYEPEIATAIQVRQTYATTVVEEYIPPTIAPTTTLTIVPTTTLTIVPTTTLIIVPTTTPTIVPVTTPTIAPNATYTPPPLATGGASRLSAVSGALVAFAVAIMAVA